ncbi:MAG: PQQ-binding-like beta-propeller repeat protein [Phycisphaerae bacterium]|jgi:outer membrane protein assembly factor BamB|nr:PQQ-binding-like beta-propeller repeat protein [Phycisphaerae bacterium]
MRYSAALLIIVLSGTMACARDGKTVTPEQAWELGWPTMQGPLGNFIPTKTGAELVDDLSKARLVWESDEKNFGRAKHTTGSFKRKGKVSALLGSDAVAAPGGWAGPIIAQGKLFATTFRPAGKVYDIKTLFDTVEKGHLEADDMLIALDAKTGKTVWKAAEPGGFVWGVGKRGGFQVAPVYNKGVVYSMGTTGRIFAYSAADGKKLWETKPESRMIAQRDKLLARSHVLSASSGFGWRQSMVFAGGRLIIPRKDALLGRDPADGKIKWTLNKVISAWTTPCVWKHSDKEYLLCATGGKPGQAKMHLIDPAAGKILWTVEGLHATQFNLAPSTTHVLVNVGSRIIKEKANGSAPKNEEGDAPFGLPGAYRITPKGAVLIWTFPDKPHFLLPTWNDTVARPRILIRDGLVYYSSEGPGKETDRRLIVAREETGKVLADQPRANDFWFQLVEDKLLHCIDWSHGSRASFDLYSTDPEKFKRLSDAWKPKQPLTTAYQVSMEPPVIAGRIFLRTETGTIVCYDLTKK